MSHISGRSFHPFMSPLVSYDFRWWVRPRAGLVFRGAADYGSWVLAFGAWQIWEQSALRWAIAIWPGKT